MDKSGGCKSAEAQTQLLQRIPSVGRLLDTPSLRKLSNEFNRNLITEKLRLVLARIRAEILGPTPPSERELGEEMIADRLIEEIRSWNRLRPVRVVNATGVILHSNLGRAILADQAIESLLVASSGPVALEFDLSTAHRGSREGLVVDDLISLTGAETATVVNNNAGAVFLILNTLAEKKEVIVSRGELVEIGDSFRIPEIMEKSGAFLTEVGTTNRTHLWDYERAINDRTAVLLKVHPSNYKVMGFASEVSLEDLARLGAARGIPVVQDLGSGAIVNFEQFGLPREPVVAESLQAGASLVSFSGDKLLGGPQAGIIAGKKPLIDCINANPLKRALRVDKLTLAALAGTLRVYLGSPDLRASLPTLRMLTRTVEEMEEIGRQAIPFLEKELGEGFSVSMKPSVSRIGSGALPSAEIPTRVLVVSHPDLSAQEICRRFRSSHVPIIGRVEADRFLLDLRGIFDPKELAPKP